MLVNFRYICSKCWSLTAFPDMIRSEKKNIFYVSSVVLREGIFHDFLTYIHTRNNQWINKRNPTDYRNDSVSPEGKFQFCTAHTFFTYYCIIFWSIKRIIYWSIEWITICDSLISNICHSLKTNFLFQLWLTVVVVKEHKVTLSSNKRKIITSLHGH